MKANDMKRVGFWYSKYEPKLPMPESGDGLSDEDRDFLHRYVNSAEVVNAYRGCSFCRLCDMPWGTMGSTDLGDGTYLWPQGLAHYVEKHHVKLPDDFVQHVLSQKNNPPEWMK